MKLTQKEIESRELLKQKSPSLYEKMVRLEDKWGNGEPIPIIQFQKSYSCSFRCSHCSVSVFRDQKYKRKLGIDDIKNVFKQADELGLCSVDVSGGDPEVFKDMDNLVSAINPDKFYIQSDMTGWNMTPDKAKHWADIGIRKAQISIDSMNGKEHDCFRNKPGSWDRAVRSIDYMKNAGLNVMVATVVDKNRVHSDEFIQFLELMKSKDVATSVVFPKLVGEWEGRYDLMVSRNDIEYVDSLAKDFWVFHHMTSSYGREYQCIATKRIVTLLATGEILPCIWLYFRLGSVFDTPLKDILDKGMKYFGKHQKLCLASESKEFIEKYISKTYGRKDLPVPIEEIMPDGKYDIG